MTTMVLPQRRHLEVNKEEWDDPRPGVKVVVTATCPMCSKRSKLRVYKSRLVNWLSGRNMIQNALPELNEHERELLITGIDLECWAELTAHMDQELNSEELNLLWETEVTKTQDLNTLDRDYEDREY